MRIALVMLASAVVGILLVGPWIDWPFPEGWVGVALMLAAAFAMRRHWDRRAETRGDEPGEPEREVWHGLASTSLIGAQIATTLYLAGPALALHSDAAHHLGRTTWTLIGGAVANRISGHVLAVLIVALAVLLGFTPPQRLAPMSHVFLAHLLLLTLVVSSLVNHALQLWGYRRDTPALGNLG
jgi:hypothetical protein